MNPELIAAIICSYIIMGLSNIVSDLTASPIQRPAWANNPTIGHFLFSLCFWPFLAYTDSYFKSKQNARGIAFAIMNTLTQVFVPILFFWLALKLVGLMTALFALQIILSIIAFYLMTFILSPITFFLATIFLLPIYFILDIIFPLKNEEGYVDPQKIQWCKTCKYFKKNKKYEETINGLWRNETMPNKELIPCKEFDKTKEIWENYYNLNQSERTLYPKNCNFWKKR